MVHVRVVEVMMSLVSRELIMESLLLVNLLVEEVHSTEGLLLMMN